MNNTIRMRTVSVFFGLMIVACTQPRPSEIKSERLIFDQGSLKVITTSVNPKLETMSVLYGNIKAYEAALKGNGQHVSGERYMYLTWKFVENPKWFGSHISENLLCIESVFVRKEKDSEYLQFDYKIEKGNPLPVNGIQLNTRDRIAYLFEYRPSILP